MIYGTTTAFLELFGLKSLKDLPTLREFTELNEDSLRVAERELGEVLERTQPDAEAASADVSPDDGGATDATVAEVHEEEEGTDAPRRAED
jgi:segregation and condensation protein B